MEALDVGGKEAALAATKKAGQQSNGRVLCVDLNELMEDNRKRCSKAALNAVLKAALT